MAEVKTHEVVIRVKFTNGHGVNPVATAQTMQEWIASYWSAQENKTLITTTLDGKEVPARKKAKAR